MHEMRMPSITAITARGMAMALASLRAPRVADVEQILLHRQCTWHAQPLTVVVNLQGDCEMK